LPNNIRIIRKYLRIFTNIITKLLITPLPSCKSLLYLQLKLYILNWRFIVLYNIR